MRLIDADVIIARCENYELKYELSAAEANRLGWLKEMIQMMPTIDPVRHGDWKETDDPMFRACSVCGYLEWGGLWGNYCPECGSRMDARMDGGEE